MALIIRDKKDLARERSLPGHYLGIWPFRKND
jgi:hypothetical protein